jgi:hypothetical protein
LTDRSVIEFADAKRVDNVDVATVDYPAGLLELLEDLPGVGCEQVNFDGGFPSIVPAIRLLRPETNPPPFFLEGGCL